MDFFSILIGRHTGPALRYFALFAPFLAAAALALSQRAFWEAAILALVS
ncbi:MAG: hypothetical protein HYR98_00710, partial [Nitrospirae bacterium]|nr:hypothetical protein [Nitrospirota bacterium]